MNRSSLCQNPQDHSNTTQTLEEVIRVCLKQKAFKQYAVIGFQENFDKFDDNMAHMEIEFIFPSKNQIVHEEVLILDEAGLVGTLGGSLGLFIGFSFYGYVVQLLDVLFDKLINRLVHDFWF